METPSMDTIYQAIHALYDNPNASEKEKASIWLADIQKSIHSWKIADELLQQKKDVQSCYFAAQTMRSKVQHNLSELPSEAIVSLRDSLVAHLERTSPDTSAAILTQLSLALADLALQMTGWQNCIGDLIKKFTNNNFALLEILTVLPQEIDSSSLKLGENRREEIKSELRSNSHIVTLFLKESIISSQNTSVSLKIIKCMTSWIQVRAVNIQEIPNNAVIGFCLQVLRDHNSINTLHDAASDCICALLHCLEENNNNENVERLLFDSVSALEESYHMAVAHENEEKAANYAKVFTELAETFLEKIIAATASRNTHFAMRSLELALVCVGHHDYEVAEITFNLWYRLSEEVYQNDYQPLTDVFKPHIERLIEALARHCQCEPDHTQLPEEGDEFYEFRMKVMGLIKDVVFIIGSTNNPCFRQNYIEEYEYVPKVVEAILSMPENTHVAVRKTCILLLGELCEWIERHPEGLEPCLQFLITALNDSQLTFAAATALQSMCSACRARAGEHVGLVMGAARLALPAAAAVSVARALAAAISHLPPDQASAAMEEAVALQLEGLEGVMRAAAAGDAVDASVCVEAAAWLDRLAALFRDVEAPPAAANALHPCLPALHRAWPLLQRVLDRLGADGRVAERWCRAVRFAARAAGAGGVQRLQLLQPLAGALAALYARRAHSCLLYLAGVLVDELARAPAAVPPLLALLHALLPRAFALLRAPAGLRDNPYTVDDLFRLCIRFLQRAPLQFLASEAVAATVQCAVLGCSLDHREANSSVMKFLHDLARAARDTRPDRAPVKALASEVITRYGEEITYALLEASVLHLHPYMLSEVAEVLLELIAWQKAAGVDWVQPSLQKLPRDRSAVATEQQCWQFHQYAMSAEKCKEMTRLLRDFARLYQ
ncbi:transportin-3 [Galleria mellonella]|uniref:Transportin-3 n=1 Tax=Galleria mellonella TaxID=7137 RepID=A0ABM3MV87_GALME|nr:transportin-3 [Galleria mellonella]